MNSFVEALESRVVPAALLTFTDVDGDIVSVQTSAGSGADLASAATFDASGTKLLSLDLRDAIWAGTSLTISALTPAGEASTVDVGYINATGNDLKAVRIDGDLGAIDAGNSADKAPGIKSLILKSLGTKGTTTGAPDLKSDIEGGLGKLEIAGDFDGAYLRVYSGAEGSEAKIGSIEIGGSLIGRAAGNSGSIYADNTIGKVFIGGSVLGGTGSSSGYIASGNPFSTDSGIKSITILESLVGNSGSDSGSIYSSSYLGSLFIGQDLKGGTSYRAGDVFFSDKAAKITIEGDFIGGQVTGTSFNTGEIHASGGIKSFFVGGDMNGGSLSNLSQAKFGKIKIVGSLIASDANFSGSIMNDGATGSITIGGDLKGGAGEEAGTISLQNVKSIKILGDVIGGSNVISGNIGVYGDAKSISIGKSVSGGDGDLSGVIYSSGKVGKIYIGGDLEGGSGAFSGMINPPSATNSLIGKVTIDGSIIGSSGDRSGGVWSMGTIKSLSVGGAVISGEGSGSGGIRADITIKKLSIDGDVTGTEAHPVFITGGGIGDGETKKDIGLGKIQINGNVSHTNILAGWDTRSNDPSTAADLPDSVNGDAGISAVKILGSWTASNIVAGAFDITDDGFGRNDALIFPTAGPSIARIGSVTILGAVSGSTDAGTHYGIVAEEIKKLTIGGEKLALSSELDSGELDPTNSNFKYLELPGGMMM